MKISAVARPAAELEVDVLVVGRFEDQPLAGDAAAIDSALGGQLTRMTEFGDFRGKLGETRLIFAPANLKARRLLCLGLGKREAFDRGRAFRAAATAARLAAAEPRKRVAFALAEGWSGEQIESGVCGAAVGCYGQDLYRAEKSRHPFEEILWCSWDELAVDRGRILADAMNLTRRLVNEPPSALYPVSFALIAEQTARDTGMGCEVWDREKLDAEKCQSLLGVARGSSQPPRLVILRHLAAGDKPTIAFVGKGVTFDSGGLSLKTTDGMKTMKCDMAGAATVLGAMQAIARLKLPVNVIGLMGLVENMPSGDSFKLGDVLVARNGKTIEVLNTDAEGRLVLADVLDVSLSQGAAKIVDLATLTGACVVALGTDVAGAMTNHQPWCDQVLAAAGACGEPVWQLPMFPEYGEQIESRVADIKNTGESRWGGAITAGKFLEHFVGGKPWTHLDIAGPAFFDNDKPWLDGGGTGAFVRTLVELARSL